MTRTKAQGGSKLRNLLICSRLASRERALQIKLPPWHCHRRGGLPVSEHRERELPARNISDKV
jgi:hypothetical protein